MYRAQFPETFKEALTQESDGKEVFGGVAIGLAAAFVFFLFLKKYGKYSFHFVKFTIPLWFSNF